MIQRIITDDSLDFAYHYRGFLVFVIQLTLIVASYEASFLYSYRISFFAGDFTWAVALKTLPLLIIIRMSFIYLFHLNQDSWRYTGLSDLIQIIKASTAGTLVFVVLEGLIFGFAGFPRSAFILDWIGNILVLSGARIVVRFLREQYIELPHRSTFKRLLIIGADDTGVAICKQAQSTPGMQLKPVAFLDDRTRINRRTMERIVGIPVFGSSTALAEVVAKYHVDVVLAGVPSTKPAKLKVLTEQCQNLGVQFMVMPETSAYLEGDISISRMREVNPIDLLGRPEAKLEYEIKKTFVHNKCVLITGAGGSIGSELTRQIAEFGPSTLVLIDRAENPLFFIENEIRAAYPACALTAEVADVTQRSDIERIMGEHRPDIVFHAAAHKHVPLMERTPKAAIHNNGGGTYVMAKCAQEAGVDTFVLVSTDKAVDPVNVMGATKRLAEQIIQEFNRQALTKFTAVRFGNVLDSNASVVPIFKQQISAGGPVTVTHPEVERYFMSIPEAAGLILQAGAVCSGGEIYVLDMGDPVKIVSLAEMLISLSGFKPYEEIDITFVGLRPGEKLAEKLHFDGEDFERTRYDKLMVLAQNGKAHTVLNDFVELLNDLPELDGNEANLRLKSLVPEYRPGNEIEAELIKNA